MQSVIPHPKSLSSEQKEFPNSVAREMLCGLLWKCIATSKVLKKWDKHNRHREGQKPQKSMTCILDKIASYMK